MQLAIICIIIYTPGNDFMYCKCSTYLTASHCSWTEPEPEPLPLAAAEPSSRAQQPTVERAVYIVIHIILHELYSRYNIDTFRM